MNSGRQPEMACRFASEAMPGQPIALQIQAPFVIATTSPTVSFDRFAGRMSKYSSASFLGDPFLGRLVIVDSFHAGRLISRVGYPASAMKGDIPR
jgi:hypothetical protein